MSVVEVVTLRSGVRAIRDCASGQIMHCGTGPAVESREIYVEPSRLADRLRKDQGPSSPPLVLFDVGLGAASNALAAWRVSESLPATARRLEIVSFDWDLGPLSLALRPEHAAAFGFSDSAHEAASSLLSQGRYETSRTTWRISFGDLGQSLGLAPSESADIVFWDMYTREESPSLWTANFFRVLREKCRRGATVHTYSAATSTRSALLLAGFAVGYGGPTGDKGQTTIAATNVEDLLSPLDERWLVRLMRSSSPFPSDISGDPQSRAEALVQVRAMPQFAGSLSMPTLP